MLKKINGRLTPDALYCLATMGEGDTVLVANANFPAYSFARYTAWKRPLDLLSGFSASVDAILSVLPLSATGDWQTLTYGTNPATMDIPTSITECNDILRKHSATLSVTSYDDFREIISSPYAVVQTIDQRPDALLLIKKGKPSDSFDINIILEE